MSGLDDLLAEHEIRQVLARYCRGIDRYDLALVRSCYHDDAVDEHGSFTGGPDEYVAWVGKLLKRYAMTMHVMASSSIERTGDVALVETYGMSFHRSGPDEAADAKLNLMTGFRFVDRFERRDGSGGGWRIAHRVAVTEWSRVDDEPGRWPVPPTLRHGTRDATDPVWWLVPELGLRRNDADADADARGDA
jgi:ketosteroid isomerase-like protein